ncbi:hemolysin-III family protein [Apiospora marii]|uniref:Hemolysin-III family protein n=1 Tax=Apiospora marii TaxID=335849 RepID=A0ABR1RYF6_9PEZI
MPKRRAATNSPSAQSGNDKQPLLAPTPPSDVVDRGDWFRAPKLLYFHQIPPWQQDNEYILSGYRPTSGSTWLSLASLSYLHNQTINAYSHLVGALIFVSLPYYFYEYVYKHEPHAEVIDLIVVSTYCIGVAVCFAFSTTFHVNWNNSKELTALCNKLDYLGILVLMWGAGIPTIYYGFYCNESLRWLYWTSTSGTALACGIFTLNPHFSSPQFRHWRACFYAGFGLSSVVFVAHGLVLHGWALQRARMSLVWMGWMAAANLVGAALYATRIPERWAPYRFDLCGASHQLFHMFIIAAAVIHFDGLVVAFRIIRSTQSPCHGSEVLGP